MDETKQLMKFQSSFILLLLLDISLCFFHFVQPFYTVSKIKNKFHSVERSKHVSINQQPDQFNDQILRGDSDRVKLAKIEFKMLLLKLQHEKYMQENANKFELVKLEEVKKLEMMTLEASNKIELLKFEQDNLKGHAKLISLTSITNNRIGHNDPLFLQLLNVICFVFVGIFFSNYLKDGLTGEISEFGQYFDKLFLIGQVPLIIFLELAFYSILSGIFIKVVSVTVNKIFNTIKRKFIMRR